MWLWMWLKRDANEHVPCAVIIVIGELRWAFRWWRVYLVFVFGAEGITPWNFVGICQIFKNKIHWKIKFFFCQNQNAPSRCRFGGCPILWSTEWCVVMVYNTSVHHVDVNSDVCLPITDICHTAVRKSWSFPNDHSTFQLKCWRAFWIFTFRFVLFHMISAQIYDKSTNQFLQTPDIV